MNSVFILLYSEAWEGYYKPIGVYASEESAKKALDFEVAAAKEQDITGDEPRAWEGNYEVAPYVILP